jgi:acetoin utilization deacetylase AcuC-like enzyme
MMKTGFVHHEKYLWHDTRSAALYMPAVGYVEPEAHTEGPESKRRFRNLLEVSGLLDQLIRIPPRPATEEEILRFHTRDYLDSIIARSADNGGDASSTGGAPFSPGAYEIAMLSAGGVIAAFDGVLKGDVDNAYALVRPPGHHAMAHEGCGFCIFGNAVIAIKHAMAVHKIERIVTIDWDVHHGNGTEGAFYDDPNVLTISIHQDENFPPGRGQVDQTGEGAGEGYNINIPLPPGSGRGAYMAIMERVVGPAVRNFKPDLVVVPSGFDANAHDPLGRMMLSSKAYRQMTRYVMGLADEVCDGRLVMCHEGGYSSAYVPFCGQAVVEEMSGASKPIDDPFLEPIEDMAGQELQPHQELVINKAAEIAKHIKT